MRNRKIWIIAVGAAIGALTLTACGAENDGGSQEIVGNAVLYETEAESAGKIMETLDTEQEEKIPQDLKCRDITWADLSIQTVIPLLFEGISEADIAVTENAEGENFSFAWEEQVWQGISGNHLLSVWREPETQNGLTTDEAAQNLSADAEAEIQEFLGRLSYSFGEPEVIEEAGVFELTYPMVVGNLEVAGNIMYTCPYSNAVDFLSGAYVSVTADRDGVQSIGLYNLRVETGSSSEITSEDLLSETEVLEFLQSTYDELAESGTMQKMTLEISEMELIYLPMLKQGKEYAEELIPVWRIQGNGKPEGTEAAAADDVWPIDALADARSGVFYKQ